MGREINLLGVLPRTKRDYGARAAEKSPDVIRVAKQFGKAFFDGERKYGYGGYRYDGRWKKVVEGLRDFYNLPEDASILDVGCAKGFLLHDFREVMPRCTVAGVDVSEYAIRNAMPDVRASLRVASAEALPYPDRTFDLAVSINSIHNLPLERLKQALREITRVTKRHAYITVDAWRTQEEKDRLFQWVLTAETMMHTDDWRKLFAEVGYAGDYWWFIAE